MGLDGGAAGRVRLHRAADSPASIYGKVLTDGFDWRRRPRASAANGCSRRAISSPPDRALRAFGDRRPGRPACALRQDRSRAHRAHRGEGLPPGGDAERAGVTSSFGARFSAPRAATILHHGCPSEGLRAGRRTTRRSRPSRRACTCRKNGLYGALSSRAGRRLRIVLSDARTFEGHCTITKGEPLQPHRPEELAKGPCSSARCCGASGRAAC